MCATCDAHFRTDPLYAESTAYPIVAEAGAAHIAFSGTVTQSGWTGQHTGLSSACRMLPVGQLWDPWAALGVR